MNLGFAKLQIQDDLAFSDTVYGIGAGIFFVGYILFEVPSNLLLHRVGAKWWIARIMVSWAIISGAMAFTNSATLFHVLRFLLGAAEAGFIPGVLLYLTYWFPAGRRGRVTAIFLAAIPAATIVGGPVSGAILRGLDEVGGLGGWQWMFLIEAVPALVLGLLVLRRLDDTVDDARWLTEEEKDVVRADVAAEEAGKDGHGGAGDVRAALSSGRVWLLCGIYFAIVVGIYLISFWLPAILSGTGAAAGIAFVNSMGNIGGAVATSLVGWLSDLTGSTAASLYAFGVPRRRRPARAGAAAVGGRRTGAGADRQDEPVTTHRVTDDDTAIALGSGEVPVLATPRLIAWLEGATVVAAREHLAEGQTSVGTAVRVRHRRPTPVGGSVDVSAEVTPTEKALTFTVRAVDGDGTVIADGEIDRVAVDAASFGR